MDAAKVVSTATAAGAGTVGVGGWVAGMLNKTKQAGKCIKANPHLWVEGGLFGGLLISLGYNVKAENEHEKRDKLVENQLRKDQAVIKGLSSKAQKIDKPGRYNELLVDALTKKFPDTTGV